MEDRKMLVYASAVAMWIACAVLGFGQKPGQPTFASPRQASERLFAAARSENEQAIMQILGAGKDLVSSGNEQQDQRDLARFVQKYEQMHRLMREPDGAMILYIGAENWPFPIPLASKNGQWYFDSYAGAQEIFFRQIGEDESTAIATCRALALGTEQPSRLTALFHGYYFRVMTQNSAGSTAASFVVAYPAQYSSSGVMTFVATPDGNVYEQDLGPETAKLASSISALQPDANWQLVK